jgi:hypothetical protein
MKVRTVLAVTRVQHKRRRDGPLTIVTMSGVGIECMHLEWTIPEWAVFKEGMTFEVDIEQVRAAVQQKPEMEPEP